MTHRLGLMIFMLAGIGSGGVSFGGEFYEANAEGIVQVPAEAQAELTEHGLTPCAAPEEHDPEKAKLADLTTAVKSAKEALKNDKTNQDLKDAVAEAGKALAEFKESLEK